MKTRRIMTVVLALASLVGTARADLIIFNSLDQTNGGTANPINGDPIAASFSTGGTASSLTDVEFFLAKPASPTGSVTFSLFSDSSTSPGTSLATLGTLTTSNLSSTPSVVDVSSFTPYALAANTRYWIEMSTSDNGNVYWYETSSHTGTGVAGEYRDIFGAVYSNSVANPQQMQVSVAPTAVPEPSSLILLGVAGLVGLVVWLSRRSLARREALPAAG